MPVIGRAYRFAIHPVFYRFLPADDAISELASQLRVRPRPFTLCAGSLYSHGFRDTDVLPQGRSECEHVPLSERGSIPLSAPDTFMEARLGLKSRNSITSRTPVHFWSEARHLIRMLNPPCSTEPFLSLQQVGPDLKHAWGANIMPIRLRSVAQDRVNLIF